jgi:hypothetical protein
MEDHDDFYNGEDSFGLIAWMMIAFIILLLVGGWAWNLFM